MIRLCLAQGIAETLPLSVLPELRPLAQQFLSWLTQRACSFRLHEHFSNTMWDAV